MGPKNISATRSTARERSARDDADNEAFSMSSKKLESSSEGDAELLMLEKLVRASSWPDLDGYVDECALKGAPKDVRTSYLSAVTQPQAPTHSRANDNANDNDNDNDNDRGDDSNHGHSTHASATDLTDNVQSPTLCGGKFNLSITPVLDWTMNVQPHEVLEASTSANPLVVSAAEPSVGVSDHPSESGECNDAWSQTIQSDGKVLVTERNMRDVSKSACVTAAGGLQRSDEYNADEVGGRNGVRDILDSSTRSSCDLSLRDNLALNVKILIDWMVKCAAIEVWGERRHHSNIES